MLGCAKKGDMWALTFRKSFVFIAAFLCCVSSLGFAESPTPTYVFDKNADCYSVKTLAAFTSCLDKTSIPKNIRTLVADKKAWADLGEHLAGPTGYCLEVLLHKNTSFPNQIRAVGACFTPGYIQSPFFDTLGACMNENYKEENPTYWVTAFELCLDKLSPRKL